MGKYHLEFVDYKIILDVLVGTKGSGRSVHLMNVKSHRYMQ